MELIAITTFLTFANITGVVADSEVMDDFNYDNQGIVTIEEVATTEPSEPKSLLEAIQLKMHKES